MQIIGLPDRKRHPHQTIQRGIFYTTYKILKHGLSCCKEILLYSNTNTIFLTLIPAYTTIK